MNNEHHYFLGVLSVTRSRNDSGITNDEKQGVEKNNMLSGIINALVHLHSRQAAIVNIWLPPLHHGIGLKTIHMLASIERT